MDDRLQRAIEFANYRVSLFNSKENIKLKVDTMLTHAVNGGIFKATVDLINFTKLVIDLGHDYVVLIDINGNPIEITNVTEFHSEILSKYFEATNYYNIEYRKLKQARTVRDQFHDLFETGDQ
jgi:hypothetical protein